MTDIHAMQGDTPLGTPITNDTTIPTGAVVINNDYLRLMVREAVEREMINQIAPIRSQQQVNAGSIHQLNRDYGALSEQIADLSAIVRGDEKLGIKGLIATVNEIGKKLSEYNDKLNNLSIYIRVGFAILIALGLLDNSALITIVRSLFGAAGVGI